VQCAFLSDVEREESALLAGGERGFQRGRLRATGLSAAKISLEFHISLETRVFRAERDVGSKSVGVILEKGPLVD